MITTKIIRDRQVLCISTYMEPRVFAQSTVTDYLNEAGFRIFANGTVEPLYLNETLIDFNPATKHEEVYLILPVQNINLLIEAARAPYKCETAVQHELKLRRLYRLFAALMTAKGSKDISEPFVRAVLAAPSCLLTDTSESELIILPPQLMRRCITAAPPETALRLHYFWIHPDGERAAFDEAASFFLAAISYTYITGATPFGAAIRPFAHINLCPISGKEKTSPVSHTVVHTNTAEDKLSYSCSPAGNAEQLIQNMRDGAFIPLRIFCPALPPAVIDLIDKSLQLEKLKCPDSPPFFNQLCAYCDEPLPFLTNQSNGETQRAIHTFIQKQERKINRKRFFIAHRGRISLLTASFLVLLGIAAAIIIQITRPPITAGLSAQEVIKGFYCALGELDQAGISAYSKNKAGTEYENLMVHLFVTEKMREAYEQKKIYYSPEEFFLLCNNTTAMFTSTPLDTTFEAAQWEKKLIAELGGGSIYGISQLFISPIPLSEGHRNENTKQFEIDFYYWIPLLPSEKTEEFLSASQPQLAAFFPIQIFHHKDLIMITEIKGNLFISELKPLERTCVVSSSSELLKDYLLSEEQRPDYLKNSARFYRLP